jgi:lysophospholipase L1-like esterase
MKIIEKMVKGQGVTIACLGDSITRGCFELYRKENGEIDTVYDEDHAYGMYLRQMLKILFSEGDIRIVNAGISGDRAYRALERLERDVLCHKPDLTVVCFGLNDCGFKENSIQNYVGPLKEIFEKLQEKGSEVIFLTPNMFCTQVSEELTDPGMIQIAEHSAKLQNTGVMDGHMQAARDLCRAQGIPVCDCYAVWKRLAEKGVDTTALLANYINHPTREMNRLFASELISTLFL